MTGPSKAVFLSYASQDADAAQRLCNTLRAEGIEVWFDQSDLRGGDAWDQKIRREIRDCALFMPLISANTAARPEGYFRLEWSLAEARSHMIARNKAFIVPVCIDRTPESGADVPESFQRVQWTRLSDGVASLTFAAQITALLGDAIPASVATTGPLAPPAAPRASTERPTPRARFAFIALFAVIAVSLAYVVFDRFRPSVRTPGEQRVEAVAPVPTTPTTWEKSVAVLPFVDMSEKKDQEYFSDGLAEELIDHLAHASDLKVIARTSSFQFKGKNEDMRTIGQRLGVANLLEGSVRTSGNTLRVTAQLINVIDGTHRWSETYDRRMGDIFKIQDEIAAAVVAALKATMAAPASERAQSPNIDAYNEILRGRYFNGRNTQEDSKRSIEALRRAIAIDPNNATAWAELGSAYHRRGLYGWMLPKAAYAESRKAVDKALALNPNEAKAHLVLGVILKGYVHETVASEMHIRRAFELDPKLADDSLNDAINAYADGQAEVALREFQRHAALNPLDPYTLSWLAGSLLDAKRLPEAERVARNILEINPTFAEAHCILGDVFLEESKFDAALEMMRQEPGEDSRLICVADALWAMGRHAEAETSITQAEAKYADSNAYQIAGHYARRGDPDNTFKWLYRAYENQEPPIQLIKGDSDLHKYRTDPRFEALLKKINHL